MIEDMNDRMQEILKSIGDKYLLRANDVYGSPVTDDNLPELFQHWSSLIQSLPAENRVLRRLFFQSIFQRELDVVDAVGETFRWIFDGDHESAASLQFVQYLASEEEVLREDMSRSFIRFLRQDGHTFLVTGKAGCGKSTFMKYIAHHEKTAAYLKDWAQDGKLVIVRLFFWQSQDAFQASIEGFWRSILFQLLSQCPELIPRVFPREQPLGAEAFTDAVEFRASELEAAFATLIQLSDPRDYRFVFFIDGLDEHAGDSDTHARLAKILVTRAALTNVKIICSSRPYTVFLDAFRTGIIVEFHKLTRSDIASFASYKFKKSLAGAEMWSAKWNCMDLVEEITEKAQGVFVWAGLAVRALINQALEHDGELKSLRQRLEECPKDLDDLFEQMLNRVDSGSQIRRKSNVALYLAVHNPFESPLNMLIYSWLDSLDWCQSVETLQSGDPANIVQRQYLEAYVATCQERVETLLRQITRGLLEVVPTGDAVPFFKYRVDLYHRSARDFLRRQWEIGAKSNPFSVASKEIEVYCRLRSLEVKALAMQKDPLRVGLVELEEDSLRENLRQLFDYTFIWLAKCSAKGEQASLDSLRELELALNTTENRFRPFTLGTMLINEEISWRYHSRITLHKCSFLHLAAYYGQENFVRSYGDSGVSSTTSRSSDLNLLLSSSVAADVQTTKFLVANGRRPHDPVSISEHHQDNESLAGNLVLRQEQQDDEASTAQASWRSVKDIGHSRVRRRVSSRNQLTTVWLVFLRDLANNVRMYLWKRAVSSSYPYHLDRDWLERLARIVEALLAAGADASAFFVLQIGHSSRPYKVDLYQMLDTFHPENLESIAELVSSRKSWWRGIPFKAVTGVLWLWQPTSSVAYETATTAVLRNQEWRVLGVQSDNGYGGELMGSFKVRVF